MSMNMIRVRDLIKIPAPYKNPTSTLFSPWNTFSLFSPPKHQPISVVWATLVYLSYFLLPATFSAFASYMSLSRIPLPSIAFVLTADHSSLPSRPSVIKFEFDPLKTIHPTSSGRRRKLVCVSASFHWFMDMTKYLGSSWRSDWFN